MLVISTKIPFVSDVFFGRLNVTSTVNSTTMVKYIKSWTISVADIGDVFIFCCAPIDKSCLLITLHFYSQTKRLILVYLINKQVLFVGTSFSFAVFLKSSYRMGLIGFEPLLRPHRPACYLLTPSLPKLLSSRARKLYRLSLRRSVHDDIQEMDFYSLFSYILYNIFN